jgi:hypothetical protein
MAYVFADDAVRGDTTSSGVSRAETEPGLELLYVCERGNRGETGGELAEENMRDRAMDASMIAEASVRTLPLTLRGEIGSPWETDETLLNLSIWWVKMTRPDSADFTVEVAAVFASLQRELR